MTHEKSLESGNIVILGAGPTGLGTALGLALHRSNTNTVVLEKKAKTGGLAGSFQWKNHIVDYGPHRLSPNLLPIRVMAEEILGPDCLIQKSQHGVQFKGKLYQFPPRVIDWIVPNSFKELLLFAWSFIITKFIWITRRFKADTFQTTITRKFGKRFYELIAAPMTEKVWVHPDVIDPAFVNQRFASVQPSAVLKKLILPKQELNPSLFYYPRYGFQQLWDNMADYIKGSNINIQCGCVPTRMVVQNNRIVQVHYKSPEGEKIIEGPDLTVVSTIPMASLLMILEGFHEVELRAKMKNIKVRSMLLVLFEFDLPRALPYRTLIYPEKDYCFNRLFEQNEYSPYTVEAGKSLIVADITLPRGDAKMNRPDAEIIEETLNDLKKLSYIKTDKITDVCVERVEFAYVVPDLDTRRTMYEIQHSLKSITNLHLQGRFGVGEYDNSDYAIDHGLTLGALLAGHTSKLEYLNSSYTKRGRYIVG